MIAFYVAGTSPSVESLAAGSLGSSRHVTFGGRIVEQRAVAWGIEVIELAAVNAEKKRGEEGAGHEDRQRKHDKDYFHS